MDFAQGLFERTQNAWGYHILMGQNRYSVHIQSPYAFRKQFSVGGIQSYKAP